MYKRILSFITVLCLVCCNIAFGVSAATPKLTVSTVSDTAPGSEGVEVTVSISDNPGIATLYFELEYDKEKITPQAYCEKNNSVAVGGRYTSNILEDGINLESYDYANVQYVKASNITGNGVLFTYKFDVKATAEGTADIKIKNVVSHAEDSSDVAFTTENGAINISSITEPSFVVSSASGFAGETVDVTVNMLNNPGIAGFKYRLAFDSSVLTPVSATENETLLSSGEALSNVDTTSGNDLETLTYVTGYWANAENITENGVIYTYKFKIKDNAVKGTYPLTLTYNSFDIIDKTGAAVDFAVINGKAKVLEKALSPKIEVSSATASAGENVQITVSLTGNPGIAGLKYKLAFDKTVLTPVSAQANSAFFTKGEALSNVDSASGNDLANLDYVTGYWADAENLTSNGVMFTYTFKVSDKASGTTPLTLSYDATDIVDKNGEVILVSVKNADVVVTAPSTAPEIEVSGDTTSAGENVQVTVSLTNNPGIAGLKYKLTFDKTVLTPVSAQANNAFFTKGEALSNVDSASGNDLANLDYVTGYWADTDNLTSNGVMFTYIFKVSNEAFGTTPLTLSYESADIVDKNGNAITASLKNSKIVITAPTELPEIEVSKAKAVAGEEVKVSVSLNKNTGIAGLKFRLAFDKNVLTPVSAQANDAFFTKGEALTNVDTASGSDLANLDYVTGYWADTENLTSNGVMFTYTFKVSDSAPLGETALNFSYETADVVNKAGEAVDLNITNGAVEVLDPATLPKVSVSSAQATAGENIKITVSMADNTGIAGLKYKLAFDKTVLTPVSAQANDAFFTKGEALSNVDSASGNDLANLDYVTGYWADTENLTSNGIMFTYTFKVSDTAAADTTPLTFSYEAADVIDKIGETVHLVATDGEVTITGPATTPKITVSEETASAGANVTVSVSMEDNSGIAGLKFRLAFDKNVLTPVSAQANSAFFTEGEALTNLDTTSGNDFATLDYVTGSWQNVKNITSNGVMFTYTFKVASTAPIGDIPLTLTYEAADMITQNGTKLACNVTNGKVSVTNQPTFTVSTTNANAGDEIEVTVSAQNNPGIAGLKYKIAFDKTLLTPVSVQINDAFFTEGEALTNVDTTSGNDLATLEYVTGSWQNTSEITSNGVMFTYKFKVNRLAASTETDLTLTYVAGDVIDKNGSPVTFEIVNGKVVITEVPLDVITGVTLPGDTVEYDGTEKKLAIEGILPDGVTVSYEGNDGNIEPGTYTVKAILSGEDYETLTLEATLVIEKIATTITNIGNIGKVYDNSAVTAPTYETNSNGAVTVEYYDSEDSLLTEAPKNAGEYKVVIKLAEATYYKPASAEKTFVIEKADSVVANISDIGKVYDDAAVAAPTYNVTGDGAVTVEYYDSEGNLLTEVPENAGTYTVKIVVAEGTNYKATSAEKTFVIEKADGTLNPAYSVPVIATDMVYDENRKLQDVTLPENWAWVTPDTSVAFGENNYKATYTSQNPNYKDVTDVDVLISITQKATIDLTGITLNNGLFVYDGETKTLKLEGEVPETVTVTYEGNGVSEVGSYDVKAILSREFYNDEELTAKLVIVAAPAPITVRYTGTLTLAKVTGLPEGWTWETPDHKITTVNGIYTAVYEDPITGLTVKENVSVTANRRTSSGVTWSDPVKEEPITFEDTADHWAEENIIEVTEKGYFEGYEDGTFRPDIGITRQEMAVVLVRLLGMTSELSSVELQSYHDAEDIADWAADSVALLTDKGIYTGYDDGYFRPELIITREQLCTILTRALETRPSSLKTLPFTDYSAWAEEYVKTMYTLGVVEGYEDGTFRGANSVTRAEAATMLLRYVK